MTSSNTTIKLSYRALLCAFASVNFALLATAQTPSTKPSSPKIAAVKSTQDNVEEKFKDIYSKEAQYREQTYPGRSLSGDDDDLSFVDESDAAEQKRLQAWRAFAKQAEALDANQLSAESRINLQIFLDQMHTRIRAIELNAHLLTFNSDSQFWASTAGMGEAMRCTTLKQCQAFLQQLRHIGDSFQTKIDLMKLGIARGMTLPRVVLTGRDASIARHIVSDPQQSVFYTAFAELPSDWSLAQKSEMQAKAQEIIRSKVVPAYAQLLSFFREEYVAKARTSIAATALPNGAEYYRAQILEYTTLDESPEHIHEIGLREVARIRADMQGIISKLKFNGDFPAFLQFLRSDPQFFAKTPHELLAEASYWAKKADGLLPKYFGHLPRKPYGVAPVPDDIAPTYTAGRYAGSGDPKRPSNYWVNTSLLQQRPMWALPALTLHEAVPGHHLQIALAGEQAEQPAFRRQAYISAFGEGWALYAESLGTEMNFFETPYQDFGRLVYEMWRAARLVVDTGMHAKGWSRDQAIQFMRENTALSEHEISTEIDRYISWPGQALAYKLGELKIHELRDFSRKTLGEKFDLRAFHDKLLSLGSVPLSVLDSEMKTWVKIQAAEKNKSK